MENNMKPGNIPGIDAEIPENAVRLYGESDAMDDFPVLKAFQQYIDAEQAKARKRLLSLGIFFGVLMFVVISVFVILLINVSAKNQALNDRMFEFAMKERDRGSSAVVVQSPQQDTSAVLALTQKLEELQKKLNESQSQAEKAAAEAAELAKEASKPKGPTPEELEIARLKALLSAEKEKQSAERERQRQLELEEYRRKHYPELYEDTPKPKKSASRPKPTEDEDFDLLDEVDKILDDSKAVNYYEEDEDEEDAETVHNAPSRPAPAQKEYSIPVDIRGSSSLWNVPND